jgi:hypothetical protein
LFSILRQKFSLKYFELLNTACSFCIKCFCSKKELAVRRTGVQDERIGQLSCAHVQCGWCSTFHTQQHWGLVPRAGNLP